KICRISTGIFHLPNEKKPVPTPKRKACPAVFDRFNDRLARDIRNSLSESFVDALTKLDQSEYQAAARKLLAGNLPDVYADYIKDRLERYARIFGEINANGISDAKIQVLVIWNHGLFFEVHDHLERLWQEADGDDYQALKGLIQAAGVYIHLTLNHRQAAERLAIKSSARMQKYAHCLTFIDNLNLLIDKLQRLDRVPPLLVSPGPRPD
ncbi:MAG: DUF309 domain-containing protein, partial [Desulfobacterales bacterium]